MTKLIYDADIDASALDGQTVAVIGYGSQGEAHARNLFESGVDVVVGLRPTSASAERAREAGLRVTDAAAAAAQASVVMILVPDTAAPAVYHDEVQPNLREGALLMFAHGFNIHFGEVDPPAGIDVGMVAPKGPGHLVRRLYEGGGGVPALYAVHRDATGTARQRTLAYARGIGAGRAAGAESCGCAPSTCGNASSATTAATAITAAKAWNSTVPPSAASSGGTAAKKATANTPSAMPTIANSRCGLALRAMVPWVTLSAAPADRPASACSTAMPAKSCITDAPKKASAARPKPNTVIMRRGRRPKNGASATLASTAAARNSVASAPACCASKR
jgi:hypothetical protein